MVLSLEYLGTVGYSRSPALEPVPRIIRDQDPRTRPANGREGLQKQPITQANTTLIVASLYLGTQDN